MSKHKKGKEVIMSDEELERLRDKITTTPSTLPYAHTVGGAVVKPEDKGKIKGLAVRAMQEQSQMQLDKVYEQVKVLFKQAEEIKSRVDISERIYQAEIKFKPTIGHVYHLYQKSDGSEILSFVSPKEWGNSMPFEKHLATVKLLSDHTWHIEESNL
ncbi:DUF2452 domain-containing protein [Fulvivirga sp. RKSG066]|uniref:DUF2452 domain-containing protein n=1 Tax=Fulvivirga aurantia TaxID=2529383 RepID=UPI0012BCAAE7|nr:DUF2452 domain-containing protein [Fulvivirga aurantia]MTI20899.1 DUF2452 domain-containing protein [Fulvivirga aurantia]